MQYGETSPNEAVFFVVRRQRRYFRNLNSTFILVGGGYFLCYCVIRAFVVVIISVRGRGCIEVRIGVVVDDIVAVMIIVCIAATASLRW